MLNNFRSAVSFLLVALTLCSTVSLPSVFAQARKPEQAAQPVPLSQRIPVGVVRGEAARLRVNKIRATNKALDRAIRDMESLGKHVNWEQSATLVFAASEKRAATTPLYGGATYSNASYSLAPMPEQQTLSDGSGEATFVTYDGDPATWDGTIYRLDYYDGDQEVYNAWMSDFGSVDDPEYWDVTNEMYYPPDGGTPTCGSDGRNVALECQVSKLDDRTAPNAAPQSASLYKNAAYTPAAAAQPVRPIINWFTRFWRCYSRTLAYRGAACINPQARIRNNLICYLAAGIYAAGCCARYAGNNYGQGICYQ